MEVGFAPVVDEHCTVLIVGSFPSVKSRTQNFYYANPQNRFWRVLGHYYHEDVDHYDIADKVTFLLNHHLALWDMVQSCDIVGSSDTEIQHAVTVDLKPLLQMAQIGKILCNGKKAYELYCAHYNDFKLPSICLPSTSPKNTSFDPDLWYRALAL